MEQDDFRQVAGELTVGFLDPVAVFLATPALLYAALCAAAATLTIPEEWFPLNAMLMVALASFSFARYALPARDGALDADWISDYNSLDASGRFCLRYLTVTAAWAIPLAVALVAATGLEAPFGREAPFTGLAGAIMVFAVFMVATGPVLACLVATASDDMSDLLQLNLWEVIIESRASAVVLVAASFGGIACFLLVYGLPLMLFAVAGFHLAPQMENAMVIFAMALPVALAPVLVGRLCGVLVRKELADALGLELAVAPDTTDGETPDTPPAIMLTITEVGPLPEEIESQPEPEPEPGTASREPAAPADPEPVAQEEAAEPAVDREPAPDDAPEAAQEESWEAPAPGSPEAETAFADMVNRAAAVSADAVAEALTEAEQTRDARAGDPYSAGEVALLSLRSDDKDAARAAADLAITRAVAHGAADVADKIYAAGRNPLQLEIQPALVKTLIPLLTRGGHIESAHAVLSQQGLLSEERCRSLAVAAFRLGQRETTLRILDDATHRWPNATFVDALLARMQKS